MRRSLGCAAMVVALVAAGCGSGTKAVDKHAVEQGAKNALAQQVGRAPQSISCPKNLDAKVGASERCTLTDNGTTVGMTVTVTKVHGGGVTYTVAVDKR